MNTNDLRNRYKEQVPFTLTELKDQKLLAAARDAINYYNMYDPIVQREAILTTTYEHAFPNTNDQAPQSVLRVYTYSLGLYNTNADNLVYEWEYTRPILYIRPGQYFVTTTYDYTLTGLSDTKLNSLPFLSKLIRCEIVLAASDKRRMAHLTELPIDFKGDQFYQEALTERAELYEKIQELATRITF